MSGEKGVENPRRGFTFFYNCHMLFRKSLFKTLAAITVLTAFCVSQSAAEEEKSLWQKFVDWFKPAPTLEGEGPLYDELRELDSKIDRVEGRYSRERRPGNKTRLKKEIEDLRTKRDKLVERIREEEKAKRNQPLVPPPASSDAKANSSAVAMSSAAAPTAPATSSVSAAPAPAKQVPACATDTVFVRDTVIVHDTLYVIVAEKPAQAEQPAQPADSATAADTAKATPQENQGSK